MFVRNMLVGRRVAIALIFVAIIPERSSQGADQAPPAQKKLIEFGWDEPDPEFLREHLAEMEKSPFDGCVFHLTAVSDAGLKENVSWICWGRRRLTEEELKPSIDDLKATHFRRLTHNFVRFNTAPANLDWFDDHSALLDNALLAARIAREGKCAGILFDVEEYEGKLFTYEKQRNARTKSWEEYAAQARRRGNEVMTRFQEGFPDLTVLLTFGYSLPRTNSERTKKPLAHCNSGLLAPFLDGMFDVVRGKARIVDGFELSYGYKEPKQFEQAYRLMKDGVVPIVADPEKYTRFGSCAFGLWMDYDWRKYDWSETNPEKNYFTPETFAQSLRGALKRSDELVWIYSETPRWWSPQGQRVKLPEAYERAIRGAR